ncbi:Uncharacterised protein [Mycobacteroides abscessus subsp. abscessus]|nr:Uncharacterised protein [Mycobacteroides abscessus subsp. abscessus]
MLLGPEGGPGTGTSRNHGWRAIVSNSAAAQARSPARHPAAGSSSGGPPITRSNISCSNVVLLST